MKEDFNLDLVAAELEKARIRPGGFDAIRYQRLAPTLISYFSQYDMRLKDIETEIGRSTVVHEAISAASNIPPITSQSIRTALDRAREGYLRRGCNHYVIVTPITLQLPQRRIARLPRSTIVVSSRLPTRFAKAVPNATNRTPSARRHSPPPGSWWCRVRVSARTAPEAHELAERDLDSLRGIWIWRRSPRLRWSSGHPYPLSPIVTGPTVTPHWQNGSSADSAGGWLRIGYAPPREPYAPSAEEWQGAIRFEREVRKALKELPDRYQAELWRCLQRYASALDDTDWESVALKLWGILEALTGKKPKHIEVIRRAAAVFPDVDLHQTILEHLRLYRNRVAHEGHWSRDAETIVCELKTHVEALLGFHASCGRHFASLAEAAAFLDLGRHRQHLRQAMKYFGS